MVNPNVSGARNIATGFNGGSLCIANWLFKRIDYLRGGYIEGGNSQKF